MVARRGAHRVLERPQLSGRRESGDLLHVKRWQLPHVADQRRVGVDEPRLAPGCARHERSRGLWRDAAARARRCRHPRCALVHEPSRLLAGPVFAAMCSRPTSRSIATTPSSATATAQPSIPAAVRQGFSSTRGRSARRPRICPSSAAWPRLLNVRGALVADFGAQGGLGLYTGTAEVLIGSQTSVTDDRLAASQLLPVVNALQPVNGQPLPNGQLPPPTVPSYLADRLKRTLALQRRIGSTRRVAAKLKVAPSTVHAQLRLGAALQSFGAIQTFPCRQPMRRPPAP